jgi:hypothetical protein
MHDLHTVEAELALKRVRVLASPQAEELVALPHLFGNRGREPHGSLRHDLALAGCDGPLPIDVDAVAQNLP